MNRNKTLLTEQDQWERTVDYYCYLARRYKSSNLVERRADTVFVFQGTHQLVSPEDVLILTCINGMVQRFGVTGVTTKGARLNNFHLPLRIGFGEISLSDDFIGMRWNDPAISRFVADLRASRRSRVIPKPWNCSTLAGVDTSGITCFGLYKSRRMRESTRNHDRRDYLRFYPDGSAERSSGPTHHAYLISFAPRALTLRTNKTRGTVNRIGDSVVVELFDAEDGLTTRYEGSFENGQLWLSCQSIYPDLCHARSPYRFHPFKPDA